MSGIEQNGLRNLQIDAIRNAVFKQIGISKIEQPNREREISLFSPKREKK